MDLPYIQALANIPGSEELLARLLGVMLAPVSGFSRALAALSAQQVFFFQAEDGIRHDLVTGVQTCALPISTRVERHDGGLGPAGKIIAEQALAGAGWAQGVARMVVLDHHPPAEAGKGE